MKLNGSMMGLGRIAFILSVGAILSAQESGQLSGIVRTVSGDPLSGATVTLESPQLMQARTVITGKDGTFRALLLPPGNYAVNVRLKDYIGQSNKGLRIGIGTKLVQEFVMKRVSEGRASVEVVATAATQDKADTKTATNYSAEQLEALPALTREFTGAADMAPGVVSGQSGSFAIRGGKTQTTQYSLNGVAVKDDYEGNLTSQRVLDDAIEDIQVVLSPLNARYGRTGSGIINVQTKSGGNEFSGSIRYELTRNDWNGLAPYQTSNGSEQGNGYFNRTYDIVFNGPVIKDRLWFAVSTTQTPPVSSQVALTSGDDPKNNPYAEKYFGSPLPGYVGYAYDHGATVSPTSTNDYIDGKLTFALTADHTFEYGYQRSKSSISNRNPYGDTYSNIIPTIGSRSYSQDDLNKYNTFAYRGTWAPNVFVESRYSRLISQSVFPSPLLDHVRLNMNNSGSGNKLLFPYGFNITPKPDERNNQSGDLNVKIFANGYGTHEIDSGLQFYEFDRGTATANGPHNSRFYSDYVTQDPWGAGNLGVNNIPTLTPSGRDPYGNTLGFLAMNYAEAKRLKKMSGNIGWAPTYREYFGSDGLSKNRTSSVYVNDQWTIDKHFGVMLGLRLDAMRIYDTDGSLLRKYSTPLAPRFKFTYDLQGDGAKVVSFTAAKFYDDLAAGLTDAFIKKANAAYTNFGWTGADVFAANGHNYGTLGSTYLNFLKAADNSVTQAGWVNYQALVNPANYTQAISFYNASANNIGMKDLTAPYMYEYTLGFRRNFTEGHFVAVNLVHREWKNDFAIVQDFTTDYAFLARNPAPGSTDTLPGMKTLYTNSNELKRRYNALELEFRNNLNSTWTIGGNYTYSRLTGNDNGGDSNAQSFRDNNYSAPLFLKTWLNGRWAEASGDPNNKVSSSQYAPDGPLYNDGTHKARIYITAQLPFGKGKVTYSWLMKYDSGYAYSATQDLNNGSEYFVDELVHNPKFGPDFQNILLPSTVPVYANGRGSFRYNDHYDVDFKVAFELPLFGKSALMGDIKINNLFNHQRRLTWVADSSSTPIDIGGHYAVDNPTAYGTSTSPDYFASPRSVAATIGLKF